MTKKKLLQEIQNWADKHGWLINPRVGAGYYADNYLKFNRCPCSRSRLKCPCEDSIKDVADTGHCLCKLYWLDQVTFDAQMNTPKSEGTEG